MFFGFPDMVQKGGSSDPYDPPLDPPLNRGTHAIFATSNKLLDIKSDIYRPSGDLVETNS